MARNEREKAERRGEMIDTDHPETTEQFDRPGELRWFEQEDAGDNRRDAKRNR